MSVWTTPATWASGTSLTAALLNAEIRDHAVWLVGALNKVTNSSASDAGDDVYLAITKDPLAAHVFRAGLTGDTGYRFQIEGDGRLSWGPGDGTFDTFLERQSNESVQLTDSALRVTRDAAGAVGGITFGLTSDTTYRVALTKDAADRGQIIFHDGSGGTPTTSIRSFGAGDLRAVSTTFRAQMTGTGDIGLGVRLSTDTNDRFYVGGGGILFWGSGTAGADVALQRVAADTLQTNDQFRALGGLAMPTVSGHVPTDADVVGAVIDGLIIGRTDTAKVYVRLANVWTILN